MEEKKVYLDANEIFRVFGREAAILYPRFASTAARNRWRLLLSDVLVIEQLQGLDSGARLGNVQKELHRIEALDQWWVCLGNLERYELEAAFSNHEKGEAYVGIDPMRDSYAEVVCEALGDKTFYEELLSKSLADAVLSSYEIGSVSERNEHWDKQLKLLKLVFKKEARKRIFLEIVGHTCQSWTDSASALSAFAEELWSKPSVCPGFRVSFETTFALLENPQTEWTHNNFYDRKHAAILPYTDVFVTQDKGLLEAISVLDSRLGQPHDTPSYRERCFRRMEEVPEF